MANSAEQISNRFSLQWKTYHQIFPHYEEHLKKWILPLDCNNFKGKSVLDAGCGMGRNSFFFAKWGASKITAFDLDDDIVNTSKNNLKQFANVTVIKNSIYDIPFENTFDIVICIGVLHHLDRPSDALIKLIKAAKPGGTILLWVYAHEGNEMLLKTLLPLREITKRCGTQITANIALLPALMLKIYLNFFLARHPYYDIIKYYPFRFLHLNIVHDQLVPYISIYFKKDELASLIKSACNYDFSIQHVNRMSYSALIKKVDKESVVSSW